MDINKLRADLQLKESLKEKTEEEKASNAKLAKGLSDIPVKKMMDQAIHIKNDLLPRIKKKGGQTSADYIFFEEIMNNLLYAITLAERYEFLLQRNTHLRIHAVFLQEHTALLEKELQKYNTVESLLYSDALDTYVKAVAKRAEDMLKSKK